MVSLLFFPHISTLDFSRHCENGESIKQIVSIQSRLIYLAVQTYQILISCRLKRFCWVIFYFTPAPCFCHKERKPKSHNLSHFGAQEERTGKAHSTP
jgi:hypothetical protein